jgi:hypothetical protein
MKTSVLMSIILAAFVPLWASAQTDYTAPDGGEKPLGTYFKTDIDSVSLTNGNLHVSIPLFSLAGRELPVNVQFDYDSQSYELRQTFMGTYWVHGYESMLWRKSSNLQQGTLQLSQANLLPCPPVGQCTSTWNVQITWAAPAGNRHTWGAFVTQSCSSMSPSQYYPYYICNNPSPASITDNLSLSDAEGYGLLTGSGGGWLQTPKLITFPDGSLWGNGFLTTPNGNQIQMNPNTQSITNSGTQLADFLPAADTLGRPISYSISSDSSTETVTLHDSQNQSQVYTINWTTVLGTNINEPTVFDK